MLSLVQKSKSSKVAYGFKIMLFSEAAEAGYYRCFEQIGTNTIDLTCTLDTHDVSDLGDSY